MKEAKFCSVKQHGYYDNNTRQGCPECAQEQRKADKIKAYKGAIQLLKNRRRYLYSKQDDMQASENCDGLSDAIATLEKRLKKIKKGKK